MAATHDTIDGLLAEFRGYSAGMPASYHVTMSWADFRKMLDRFEAAHKREVATTKESLAVGNSGDCAKLREACANIAEYARSAQCHTEDAHVLGYLNQIERWANAALAEPVKNCEVGTAEEQDERFHRFCVMQRKGSCAGCPDPVGGRTVANGIRECALVWAQMPYEEGGAK